MLAVSTLDLTSTRRIASKTSGLLPGMRVAWSSRIAGDITFPMDNRSAATVFQDFKHRGLRLVSSQDC